MLGIYGIFRIGTPAQCYVGQSVNIRKRMGAHKADLRNKRHASRFMQSVYNKYGLEAFEFRILEIVHDVSLLNEAENRWMEILRPEFNSAEVAGSCVGVKHSDETKAKHRARMIGNSFNKGRASHRRGAVLSEETRMKISLSKRGLPNLKRRGVRHTAESIAKMSRNRSGIPSEKKGVPSGKKGVPWTPARWAAFRSQKMRTINE